MSDCGCQARLNREAYRYEVHHCVRHSDANVARLEGRVIHLRSEVDHQTEHKRDYAAMVKELKAENERLRKENKTWATAVVQRRTEIERLEANRERLEKFIVERCGPTDCGDCSFFDYACDSCGEVADGSEANIQHKPDCLWKELTEGK